MKASEYVPAAVLVRRKWRAGELKKKNANQVIWYFDT